jgi:hypothetical protein
MTEAMTGSHLMKRMRGAMTRDDVYDEGGGRLVTREGEAGRD